MRKKLTNHRQGFISPTLSSFEDEVKNKNRRWNIFNPFFSKKKVQTKQLFGHRTDTGQFKINFSINF